MMMTTAGAVGRRLADARVAAGLTQAQLGEMTGLSGRQVRRIEAGEVPAVNLDWLARAAQAVHSSQVGLLCGECEECEE